MITVEVRPSLQTQPITGPAPGIMVINESNVIMLRSGDKVLYLYPNTATFNLGAPPVNNTYGRTVRKITKIIVEYEGD